MPEVGSWKDWLLWPLRTCFQEQAHDVCVPPSPDETVLGLVNTLNQVSLKNFESGKPGRLTRKRRDSVTMHIATPEGAISQVRLKVRHEPSAVPSTGPKLVEMPQPVER